MSTWMPGEDPAPAVSHKDGPGQLPCRFLLMAGPDQPAKIAWIPQLVPTSFTLLSLDSVRYEMPGHGYARPEFAARRILLMLLDECARQRIHFALETPKPGRALPRRIGEMRRAGYVVQSIWLERAPDTVAGGAGQATLDARRDFETRIAPACDAWALLEQAGDESRIIAAGEREGAPPGSVFPAGFLLQNLRLAMREHSGPPAAGR